jgi:acyl carrier protein
MTDITTDVIATDVITLIRRRLPAGKSTLDLVDRLEDLGIDSLGVVELIFDLEEKFNILIPYNANDSQPEFETVGEVVNEIKNLIDKKS